MNHLDIQNSFIKFWFYVEDATTTNRLNLGVVQMTWNKVRLILSSNSQTVANFTKQLPICGNLQAQGSQRRSNHYNDVITGAMASQITSLTKVYSIVYSGAYQRKHKSSASLAFVRVIHRWPVNSPHKWSGTRKMFPFDDVIMTQKNINSLWCINDVIIASCIHFTAVSLQITRLQIK